MFTTRPCGCKGQRSCLVCETEFGAFRLQSKNFTDDDKENSYYYCPLCENLAWPGWNALSWKEDHPNHKGKSIKFNGVKIILEFVDEKEERDLVKNIDEVPWCASQSGRLKQNYGPKCNFKKKKVKIDNFDGYPLFTKFIQDRFRNIDILHNFQTVEQCSLEYKPERGASIDPHIDDCWIWGERIPTINLLSDSVLTLIKYSGPPTKYNLEDTSKYPELFDNIGKLKSEDQLVEDFEKLNISNLVLHNEEPSTLNSAQLSTVRIPMPRRSLLIFYGEPRYRWEHGIIREDITERRVCITYRELTPPFMAFGPHSEIGQKIINVGQQFWNHKDRYCS